MRRTILLLASSLSTLALVMVAGLGLSTAQAGNAPDYDVAQGHFYSQGAGSAQNQPLVGYSITDDGGIPMWTEFQRLGGVDALGYPVSGRFQVDGHVIQLTQKVGLVWHPKANQVRFLDIFNILHKAGKDGWLATTKGIPPVATFPNETGKSWDQVSRQRYSLLDIRTEVKKAYFAMNDPVNMYGLPTSSWLETPLSSVMRFENVVIEQWRQELPWAQPGQVQLANGGQILKDSGILGQAPFVPQPAPAEQAVQGGFAVASFYADSFQGRPMSNGRIFSQAALTCASNAFPLNERLRLSTPDGSHSIVVVNEDHPAAWNSRIDLSKAAFSSLYPLSRGLGTVKIEILR
ncbi:MAG: hypothetical protein ACYDAG_10950 [Chloroflexota bacterium]